MGGPGSGRRKGSAGGPSRNAMGGKTLSKGRNERENLSFAKKNKLGPKVEKKIRGKIKYLKKSGQFNNKA